GEAGCPVRSGTDRDRTSPGRLLHEPVTKGGTGPCTREATRHWGNGSIRYSTDGRPDYSGLRVIRGVCDELGAVAGVPDWRIPVHRGRGRRDLRYPVCVAAVAEGEGAAGEESGLERLF